MKLALSLPSRSDLQQRRFWLVALVAMLIVSHFTLVDRTSSPNFVGLCLLVYAAVVTLIFRKYDDITLKTSPFPLALGSALAAISLMRLAFAAPNPGLRVIPLLSGVGLALIAQGWQGVRTFWKELIIVGLLAIPSELGVGLINLSNPLSLIIAKISAFILWYLGFPIRLEGSQILFSEGGVFVKDSCAGVANIIYVLQVATIASLLFPLSRVKWRFWVFGAGIALSFLMNLFRVTLLTAFYPVWPNAFEYWHHGDGSLIFSALVIVGFSSFYLWLMQRDLHHHEVS